ncbi:MAG: aminotransferase class I/II-fold pyridoxal phosphate-dependent enzyme [Ilumatobacteraceae bacterium]
MTAGSRPPRRDTSPVITVPATTDHGGDGPAVARRLGVPVDRIVDLSANLNPFAPPIDEVLARHIGRVRHYPHPDELDAATGHLATAIGVGPERLVLTNGSAEAIALVARHVGSGLVVEPEFATYRRHLVDIDDPTAGRWRSNPNSPLGTLAPADAAAAVWDEAYWPMTCGTWTRGDDTAWRIGSFTKLWACPGLRLGYAIAPTIDDAAAIAHDQPEWSVGPVALAALGDLLDQEDLTATAARLGEHRGRFADELTALGYRVRPGVAPWLLLDGAAGLRELLVEHRVVVRDCTSYGLPGTHRLALPAPAALDQVLAALAAVRPELPG